MCQCKSEDIYVHRVISVVWLAQTMWGHGHVLSTALASTAPSFVPRARRTHSACCWNNSYINKAIPILVLLQNMPIYIMHISNYKKNGQNWICDIKNLMIANKDWKNSLNNLFWKIILLNFALHLVSDLLDVFKLNLAVDYFISPQI